MTDDELMARLRARVEAGAALDIVSERLEVSSMKELLGRGAGGYYQGDGAGRWVAKHLRGSEGHRVAETRGAVIVPTLLPTLSSTDLDRAEEELGHPLPSLLRRLYGEVANGGFGPGYGLLAIRSGSRVDDGRKRVRADEELSEAAACPLVRVCDHGCGIATLVDVSTPESELWTFDPNRDPVDELYHDRTTLARWLEAWVESYSSLDE